MKKYIHLIEQHDETDCGAACLSMILQHYGKKLPLATVCEAIKVDQYGANFYGIMDGAKKYGLEAQALEGECADFFTAVQSKEIQLPIIARIVNRFQFEHFIVVTAITKDTVYYCDPGEGRRHLKKEAFAQCFLGQIVAFEKTQDFVPGNMRKGSFTRFWKLISRQKGLLFLVSLLSFLVTGIGLGGTFLFQFLIDHVLTEFSEPSAAGENLELFALLIGSIGILYFLRFITELLRGRLLAFMTKRVNLPLMLGYYNHVIDLPMNFFGTHKTGDIISRFHDASKIQEALSSVTLTLMIDVIMVLFCGGILYHYSASLFSVTLVIFILYILITCLYIKPLEKNNRKLMETNGQLSAYLKESIDGIQTLKAFRAEDHVKSHTKSLFTSLQNHGVKNAMLVLTKDSFIELLTSIGILCLLWTGAVSVLTGEMTLGVLVTFYTLLSYFLTPIQNIIELQSTLQSALTAADRLRDILDRTVEDTQTTITPISNTVDSEHYIQFQNVDFRYGNRDLVLNQFSCTIKKGQHIALVGNSGCGKTTIAKLLLGFYAPENGSISVNGTSLHKWPLNHIRSQIAYVPQETFLFSSTIRENLLLGNQATVSDEQINTVLDACGCDFIQQLPFGLDSALEEGGTNLSGGQRQRLAIARALLRNPQILILDEATSNLDSISEHQLQKSLQQLSPDLTLILIAHRLNTVQSCDQIFVLNQGSLAEAGTHEELLQKDSYYSKLWKCQML